MKAGRLRQAFSIFIFIDKRKADNVVLAITILPW
jgi:hypothetical protein